MQNEEPFFFDNCAYAFTNSWNVVHRRRYAIRRIGNWNRNECKWDDRIEIEFFDVLYFLKMKINVFTFIGIVCWFAVCWLLTVCCGDVVLCIAVILHIIHIFYYWEFSFQLIATWIWICHSNLISFALHSLRIHKNQGMKNAFQFDFSVLVPFHLSYSVSTSMIIIAMFWVCVS